MGVIGRGVTAVVLALIGQATPKPESVTAARRLAMALVGLLLILIVATTGYLLLRSLQRTRQRMMQRKPAGTEWVDVWRLHRLPREEEPEQKDEPGADDDSPGD
jgi:hypothetical protein